MVQHSYQEPVDLPELPPAPTDLLETLTYINLPFLYATEDVNSFSPPIYWKLVSTPVSVPDNRQLGGPFMSVLQPSLLYMCILTLTVVLEFFCRTDFLKRECQTHVLT